MSTTQMFDELTKQVATVTSRRQVFKVLAGGVAAVAGTLLGSRSAEAAEAHLCCVYFCPENESLAHRCIRIPPGIREPFCPEVKGCDVVSRSVTSKCSDCGGA